MKRKTMYVNKPREIVFVTSDEDSSSDDEVFAKNKKFRNATSEKPLLGIPPKGQKSTQQKGLCTRSKPAIAYTTSEESCSPQEPTEKKIKSHDAPRYESLFKFSPDDEKTCRKDDFFSHVASVTYATSDEDSSSCDSDNRGYKGGIFKNQPPREPQVRIQHSLQIEGVKVEMPVKPYPCQRDVMSAIIMGCNTKQHCLLESPTGSGKTLALLCGSLAWQNDFTNKYQQAKDQKAQQREAPKSMNNDPPMSCKDSCRATAETCEAIDDFDLDDLDWSDDGFDQCKKTTPTIYYGSRTHRQIEQVVRELRKTSYSEKNMTVLSSREYTCIQESDRDKTALCNDLLDPKKKFGCPYYTETNKYTLGSNSALRSLQVNRPFDIEDLVDAGKELHACPYFAARSLMAEADIIFCPYNYIIDPVIRDNMQIDLSGSIIILDEAHNIENICRECGSASIPIDELEKVSQECESIQQTCVIHQQLDQIGYVSIIEQFMQNLLRFINNTTLNQQPNSESLNSDTWTGTDFVHVLEITKSINAKDITNFTSAARQATIMHNMAKDLMRTGKETPPTLHHDVIRIVEKTLMGFKMISTAQYTNDYRVVIRQTPLGYKKEKSLEFMCMNPGVIFVPICNMARTVILASGTLAPTSSYQGELGVKFPFTLQADHVTPPEQVFIKSISRGPAGTSLRATYQNVNQWGFQDDLGGVLLTACEAVPHGILMFFSSYTTMGTLLRRWKTNGMWNKISRVKTIFQETRGSADLATMMDGYRQVICTTADGPVGTVTGALLFAVFRGKVAEGIDFSDNEARCVLTVGIPYAVKNDPVTNMKYQYNDLNRHKGLLSGTEWYTIQAFRALNQALGRAIRHQNDWGAIILVDERFREPRNVNLLPTWVRSMCQKETGSKDDLRQLLKCFVAQQIKRERGKIRLTQTQL